MYCLQKGANLVPTKPALISRHRHVINLQRPFVPGPRAHRTRRLSPYISAIGFDLTGSAPDKSPERIADELSRAAASLLLYQSVLKSKPAQAFMNILLHLQKGSPLKLMEHYGELYKALANDGFSSWQDYVVDQVLRGYDNPFAKAASRGEPSSHLLPAVAHDLSVLQSLAVTESTLTGWVNDTVRGLPESWMNAAVNLGHLPASSENGATAAASGGSGGGGDKSSLEALLPKEVPAYIQAPLSKDQRAVLKSHMSKQSDWSDSAVLLERYYSTYDYGLFSMHKVLKWTGDRLQAQDVLEGVECDANSIDEEAARRLASTLSSGLLSWDLKNRKVSASSDNCIAFKTKAMYSVASYRTAAYAVAHIGDLVSDLSEEQMAAAGDLRIVLLPQAHQKDAAELAWTLSQHPRTRVVVITGSTVGRDQLGGDDFYMMIGGCDGCSWPRNAVMVVCGD